MDEQILVNFYEIHISNVGIHGQMFPSALVYECAVQNIVTQRINRHLNNRLVHERI